MPTVSLRSKFLLAHFYQASDLGTFTGKENTNTVDHTELKYGSTHQGKVDACLTSTWVNLQSLKGTFWKACQAPVGPSFTRWERPPGDEGCCPGCSRALPGEFYSDFY